MTNSRKDRPDPRAVSIAEKCRIPREHEPTIVSPDRHDHYQGGRCDDPLAVDAASGDPHRPPRDARPPGRHLHSDLQRRLRSRNASPGDRKRQRHGGGRGHDRLQHPGRRASHDRADVGPAGPHLSRHDRRLHTGRLEPEHRDFDAADQLGADDRARLQRPDSRHFRPADRRRQRDDPRPRDQPRRLRLRDRHGLLQADPERGRRGLLSSGPTPPARRRSRRARAASI